MGASMLVWLLFLTIREEWGVTVYAGDDAMIGEVIKEKEGIKTAGDKNTTEDTKTTEDIGTATVTVGSG